MSNPLVHLGLTVLCIDSKVYVQCIAMHNWPLRNEICSATVIIIGCCVMKLVVPLQYGTVVSF